MNIVQKPTSKHRMLSFLGKRLPADALFVSPPGALAIVTADEINVWTNLGIVLISAAGTLTLTLLRAYVICRTEYLIYKNEEKKQNEEATSGSASTGGIVSPGDVSND